MIQENSLQELRRLAQEWEIPLCEKVVPLPLSPESAFYEKVSIDFLKERGIIPVEEKDQTVTIALSEPSQLDWLDTLAALLEKRVRGVLASSEAIRAALHQLEQSRIDSPEKVLLELEREDFSFSSEKGEPTQDLMDQAAKGPVVKLVNRLIFDALERRATDIHVQPGEKKLEVRLRVDGVLYDWGRPPQEALEAIVSRIKVMSGLNIAEKRLPQDGRTSIKLGDKEVDIRVSVVPTVFGERVVLRLLDKGNLKLKLEELGFAPEMGARFRKLIAAPHGIVLVTGPTGSGKTTTLYAALATLRKEERNIMTVEDPVEYRLEGISQMQVKPEIGLTFAAGLRALLRQDPDVLMVGEIRDAETARVAVQAALTGHLVLATLHTNDAPGALTRLEEIGVEPYLLSSTVRGVLAQRLVRLLCRNCRGQKTGCPDCFHTGFRGRIGIYELLVLDASNQKTPIKTLLDDGMEKIAQGLTSREEVLRVTAIS